MGNTDSMKLLTDIVFQKKVPSESWQEYQKDQEQSAQYHHIKYGLATNNGECDPRLSPDGTHYIHKRWCQYAKDNNLPVESF